MTAKQILFVVAAAALTAALACDSLRLFSRTSNTDSTSQTATVSEVAVRRLEPSLDGKWVVQVGAFTNTENAVKYGEQFSAAGYTTFVLTGVVNNVEYNKVQVGPYSAESEARSVCERIKTSGLNTDAFIVQLKNEQQP